MAMALAATVVKRKAMTATSVIATSAWKTLPSITPNQKKRNVMISVTIEAMAMNLNDRSFSVRFAFAETSLLPPFISCAASPTALLMMPHDLMIPMIPAIAMPPMPIDLP